MTGSKASQDAKPADEPLAALAPERDGTDWPAADRTGAPDEPAAAGGADPVTPAAPPATGFPLWPDSPEADRSLGPHGEHPDRHPDAPVARRVPKPPRRPLYGLPLMVVLALVALLFGWLGAEPFWLAVHHGDAGTLTITSCTGSGVGKHCVGRFVPADGRYTVGQVTMSGAQDAGHPGARLAARMVGEGGRLAYVGGNTGLLLRWTLPLAAVVACGLLIGLATGAWRLRGRSRFGAVTLSLLGPLAITACVLALTW